MATQDKPAADPGGSPRFHYGYRVVVVGLIVLGGMYLLTLAALCGLAIDGKMANITVTDLVALVGLFTSVVGTTIGAYFGMQFGSAGRERAEAARDAAQDEVKRLAAVAAPTNPRRVATILGIKEANE